MVTLAGAALGALGGVTVLGIPFGVPFFSGLLPLPLSLRVLALPLPFLEPDLSFPVDWVVPPACSTFLHFAHLQRSFSLARVLHPCSFLQRDQTSKGDYKTCNDFLLNTTELGCLDSKNHKKSQVFLVEIRAWGDTHVHLHPK